MAEEKVEAPDIQKQFAELLVSHKVKPDRAENIARYIAESSEGAVFEDPAILADKLAECHDEIDPVRRRRILRHWFAKKGAEVPEEVLKGIVTGPEREKLEKKKQKAAEGRLWFVGFLTGPSPSTQTSISGFQQRPEGKDKLTPSVAIKRHLLVFRRFGQFKLNKCGTGI